MNFKKRVNGSWTDTPHYIHNASTDTITTLPAVLYPNATTATVGLKGQTLQSSVPSPTSPVMPQGTGERTGNLADTLMGGVSTTDGSDTVYTSNQSQVRSQYILCTPNTQYTVSANKYPVQNFIAFYNENKEYVSRTSGIPITQERIFEVPDNAVYMRVTFTHATAEQLYPYIDEVKIMLNLGSTALPYEPFGVKIPISSASTTTPVYLGEVESTRRIKKYEFTGEENWIRESGNTYALEGVEQTATGYDNALCTHYVLATSYNALIGTDETFSVSRRPALFIHDENFTTAAQLKTYLATQYAAGTPVCVWYALATEETGIFNEPIRKIGDYADTVSGISIPTITGKDTFDVETTLKPSEVSLSYTGWHDATVKEWDGSDWQ